MPYFEDSTRILHSPPCRPDVNVVPYRSVSDKILLMFNSNINQSVERPIIILDNDARGFQEQIDAQQAWGDRLSPYPDLNQYWQQKCDSAPTRFNNFPFVEQTSIMFETDDPTLAIQIFRTRQKPTEYRDFKDAKIYYAYAYPTALDISNQPSFGTDEYHEFIEEVLRAGQRSYSASFVDSIEPNVKYYYCFRAIDGHLNVSNPTDLYEVEMFKEGETMYLIFRVVDFAPKILFDKKKSFKKYIKIQPAVDQIQIPPENVQIEKFVLDDEGLPIDFNFTETSIANSANDASFTFPENALVRSSNVSLGTRDEKLYTSGKTFKFRFRSKNTSKVFDLDVDFATDNNFKKID